RPRREVKRRPNGAVAMPGGGHRWKTLASPLRHSGSASSFPPLPTALGNRNLRDFHIPTAPTMISLLPTNGSLPLGPGTNQRRIPALAGFRPSTFQAHPALESNFDFRLISGLENAARGG